MRENTNTNPKEASKNNRQSATKLRGGLCCDILNEKKKRGKKL